MPLHLHLLPLAGFAGLMVMATFADFRRFVIPNPIVLGLFALWPLHVAAAPSFTVAGSAGALGCAAAVFLAGALLFSRGLMGGGDVKLLAVGALWAGPALTPALLFVTAVLGGLLALAWMSAAALRALLTPAAAVAASPLPMPYGVAIAAAAVIVTIPPNVS
jgi:prepilin peptidase CpaA